MYLNTKSGGGRVLVAEKRLVPTTTRPLLAGELGRASYPRQLAVATSLASFWPVGAHHLHT